MGIAHGNINNDELLRADGIFDHFVHIRPAKFDDAAAGDDEELLRLGMVPVVSLDNAGLADINRDLTARAGAQKLRKTSARILVHGQRIGELHHRQKA